MLAPEDTKCGRCGRAVGVGTHLRWYLSWAAGLAVLGALFTYKAVGSGSSLRLVGAAAVFGGLAGGAIAWLSKRRRNSESRPSRPKSLADPVHPGRP